MSDLSWFFNNMSSSDMNLLNNFNKNMDIIIDNVNLDEITSEKKFAVDTLAALRSGLQWNQLELNEVLLLEKHVVPSQLAPFRPAN